MPFSRVQTLNIKDSGKSINTQMYKLGRISEGPTSLISSLKREGTFTAISFTPKNSRLKKKTTTEKQIYYTPCFNIISQYSYDHPRAYICFVGSRLVEFVQVKAGLPRHVLMSAKI